MLNNLIKDLKKSENKKQAEILQRFFKTGKGEYGEGDIFLGVKVPIQRSFVKRYDLSFEEIQKLLDSEIHEYRMCGVLSLVKIFENTDDKKRVFDFYLKNTKKINNWDLVDVSCPKIVGNYLLKDSARIKVLHKLSSSKNLWDRRISIVSVFSFIRNEKYFGDVLKICERLLGDSHDLIHKAVGWMLRELGKKNKNLMRNFLKNNYDKISRTTLRYSIERFEEKERKEILKGDFR